MNVKEHPRYIPVLLVEGMCKGSKLFCTRVFSERKGTGGNSHSNHSFWIQTEFSFQNDFIAQLNYSPAFDFVVTSQAHPQRFLKWSLVQ